jgi:hypothetical protein
MRTVLDQMRKTVFAEIGAPKQDNSMHTRGMNNNQGMAGQEL